MPRYDYDLLSAELGDRLDQAIREIATWAIETTATLDGITPEDARMDIGRMLQRHLSQAATNANHGSYRPTLKKCEQVAVDGAVYLVHYQESERSDRESCLAYLRDCDYQVTTTPHDLTNPDGVPIVSWGGLSDLIGSRDD
jgi:hypothetical protein